MLDKSPSLCYNKDRKKEKGDFKNVEYNSQKWKWHLGEYKDPWNLPHHQKHLSRVAYKPRSSCGRDGKNQG